MKSEFHMNNQQEYYELLKRRMERAENELLDLHKKMHMKEIEISQLDELLKGMKGYEKL